MTAEGGVGRMATALITGASRGMGLTVAQALADHGLTVDGGARAGIER